MLTAAYKLLKKKSVWGGRGGSGGADIYDVGLKKWTTQQKTIHNFSWKRKDSLEDKSQRRDQTQALKANHFSRGMSYISGASDTLLLFVFSLLELECL